MRKPCTREYAHVPHWFPVVGLPIQAFCHGRRRFDIRTIKFTIKSVYQAATSFKLK